MEEERKKGKKRKTPENCKKPMQRQRFITTIKNVTEGKKKSSKAYNANKINNYNRVDKKRGKNPEESTEQVKT